MSVLQQLLMAYGAGAGGGGTFSIVGVSTSSSASSVSVPAGAAAGDMLILCFTNGTTASFTMPGAFTTIFNSGTNCGAIGWRTMQAGDTSFALGVTAYVTLIAVRRSSGTPAIDQTSASSILTAGGTYTTPTITPSVADTASIMLFVCGQSAFTGAPGFTQLIAYNVNGAESCGMAASWTSNATTAPFAGTTAVGTAGASHNGVAVHIVIK
jgi:hypothetical protein